MLHVVYDESLSDNNVHDITVNDRNNTANDNTTNDNTMSNNPNIHTIIAFIEAGIKIVLIKIRSRPRINEVSFH